MDRRAFLARTAAVAGGTVAGSEALMRLANRSALADLRAPGGGYGPLTPMPDQNGRVVLALPDGFSYVTFGDIGSPMSDGMPTPLALDGMAAFKSPRGTVRLIRNHEDRNLPPAGSLPARPGAYDPRAGGGTTTLDYDPKRRRLVRSFISLDGTTVNCAGGFGLHARSWLTGEETVAGPSSGFAQPHGYLFEVPLDRGPGDSPHSPPLREMGRFAHEAAATDRSGVVYETEDPGSGRGAGFYRFLPRDKHRLGAGGRLQILGIADRPQYDAREGQVPGRPLPVRWIDIPDPDPEYVDINDPRGTFDQGWARGAAKFNRLEGCWYADGSVFFVSTSGGDEKSGDVNSPDGYREGYGQVWEYRIRQRRLILHYESPGGEVLDSPDNLTVTPRGGLLLCEDDASTADGESTNRVIGISPGGQAFAFAENVLSDSELAGACFSPDGDTLFVNIFGDSRGTPAEHAGEGTTCAITGPWRRGPL